MLKVTDTQAWREHAETLASELQRDDEGALWLRTGGDREAWYEVPPEIADAIVVDQLHHLARVASDELGVPRGPVLELEPGFRGSDAELWQRWRRLLSDAG